LVPLDRALVHAGTGEWIRGGGAANFPKTESFLVYCHTNEEPIVEKLNEKKLQRKITVCNA